MLKDLDSVNVRDVQTAEISHNSVFQLLSRGYRHSFQALSRVPTYVTSYRYKAMYITTALHSSDVTFLPPCTRFHV